MAQPQAKLVKFDDRISFTTFPSPIPSPDYLNSHTFSKKSSSSKAAASTSDKTLYHFFTIDHDLVYQSFADDFGPLNISMVYTFCLHLHDLLLKPELEFHTIVLYSSSSPKPKANAALMMALYILIVQRKAPWEAFYPIANMEFLTFRDAGKGKGDFHLGIQDFLFGTWKALKSGLLNLETFDTEEYEHYERVENGDFNWVSKHFIAFASPQEPHWLRYQNDQATSFPAHRIPQAFQNVVNYFVKSDVGLVVRLNNPLYNKDHFTDRGIKFKEMYFDDGTNPTPEMVREFIAIADDTISRGQVVAIHCKAGLGRTGCLIGAYLTYKYGFTASESIAFMRIMRPGMVVGPQQQYMMINHLEWVKWAAADEALSEYKASLRIGSTSEVSRPVTPPSEGSHTPPSALPVALPPVTPARVVSGSNSAAEKKTPPGQPRKTPKRGVPDDVEGEVNGCAPSAKRNQTAKARSETPPASKLPASITQEGRPRKAAGSKLPLSSVPVSTRRTGPAATESRVIQRGATLPPNASPTPSTSATTSRLPTFASPNKRALPVPTPTINSIHSITAALEGHVAPGSPRPLVTRGEISVVRSRYDKIGKTGGRGLKKRRSSLSAADVLG